MDGKDRDVLVTDKSWAFLPSTRPAKARKLLRDDKANLLNEVPPLIQLNRTVIQKGEMNMSKEEKVVPVTINEYFKKNEEVYVQNLSGSILSMEFRDGDMKIPITIPNISTPLCLTDRIPKELIVRSADFRKFVMSSPPRIRLMTVDEYSAQMVRVAKDLGTSVDEAVKEAGDQLVTLTNKSERLERPEEDTTTTHDPSVPGLVDSPIQPRVMQIISNCSPDAKPQTPADSALKELRKLKLTADDLNFILTCTHPAVRKFATARLSDMTEEVAV